MNEQLLSTIVGALTIGIGFISWRYGRTSPSYSARSLGLPVFMTCGALGLGCIIMPIIETFFLK